MKPMRLILCIAALMFACITASAMSFTDTHTALSSVTDGGVLVATAVVVGVGNITPQMIQDAKLKFGAGVKVLTVVVAEAEYDAEGKELLPKEEYHFLVRRPDRSHIKMLLPLAKAGEIDEFADKAVKNLIVDGDMDKLDDGLVYMGVVSQLEKLIAPAASFLKSA